MKRMLMMLIVILSVAQAYAAPPKSLAGLWVATDNDTAYWLRVSVSSIDQVALIEDVSGTIITRSVESNGTTTTSEMAVVGQYLPGTRTVALNLGEPGVRRQYALGNAPEERTGRMSLKVFRVRPAQGINYERQIFFAYKGPLPAPTNPATGTDVARHAPSESRTDAAGGTR